MRSTRAIWNDIYEQLTLKQYCKITKDASGLYKHYFENTLKFTKSKKLYDLALQGLARLDHIDSGDNFVPASDSCRLLKTIQGDRISWLPSRPIGKLKAVS